MNIQQSVLDRINKRLTETKNPCKTYKSAEAAEKAAQKLAEKVSHEYQVDFKCDYLIVFIPAMGRWTAAFDASKFIARIGGGCYLGMFAYHNFYQI